MSTNKKINIVVWGLGKHAINNILIVESTYYKNMNKIIS